MLGCELALGIIRPAPREGSSIDDSVYRRIIERRRGIQQWNCLEAAGSKGLCYVASACF
jgi:hypothetical protein